MTDVLVALLLVAVGFVGGLLTMFRWANQAIDEYDREHAQPESLFAASDALKRRQG